MSGPVKKIRAGSVSCALWNNEATVNGRKVAMLKATIDRRYKDSSGTWKSSNSFSRNEIPLAIYCLGKAFQAMIEERDDDEQ
jgi:hypothetical protein